MNINPNYDAATFANVVDGVGQRWSRMRERSVKRVGRDIRIRDTFNSQGDVTPLIPTDADAVAAVATSATLQQTLGRARTVVDGQPLGCPG